MKYFETGKKSFINDLKGFKKCLFFVSFQNLNWVDELVVDHPFLDEPCRYVNRSELLNPITGDLKFVLDSIMLTRDPARTEKHPNS
jgi:hypothetical protein